jgi:hypothetical protein
VQVCFIVYILLLEIQLSREDGSDLLDQLTLYCLSLTISDFDSSIFFCVQCLVDRCLSFCPFSVGQCVVRP